MTRPDFNQQSSKKTSSYVGSYNSKFSTDTTNKNNDKNNNNHEMPRYDGASMDEEEEEVIDLSDSENAHARAQAHASGAVQQVVHVEVELQEDAEVMLEDAKKVVLEAVAEQATVFHNGPMELDLEDKDGPLASLVRSVRVEGAPGGCSFFEAEVAVHLYQLSHEGPSEEVSAGEDAATMYVSWTLPAVELDGLWDSLVFEEPVKEDLLDYVSTSMLFADTAIDPSIITWNHVVLLHGPPGTGKTSLCKALAQKVSIRMRDRFANFMLLEVNAHSLFSKWFSESGKLVGQLFEFIHDLVEDEGTLVMILIDEVESLAAMRNSSGSSSEPSDAIRVVNALLTQLDQLKSSPNAFVFTTSNLSQAIDVAFVDRADIKLYLGPPGVGARVRIIASCAHELMKAGMIYPKCELFSLVDDDDDEDDVLGSSDDGAINIRRKFAGQIQQAEAILKVVAEKAEGWSGRRLRKLPFQAHAKYIKRATFTLEAFANAMHAQVCADVEDSKTIYD